MAKVKHIVLSLLLQLETLSRDDLLKFVKKQMLLQHKMKSRCDGLLLSFALCDDAQQIAIG